MLFKIVNFLFSEKGFFVVLGNALYFSHNSGVFFFYRLGDFACRTFSYRLMIFCMRKRGLTIVHFILPEHLWQIGLRMAEIIRLLRSDTRQFVYRANV